MKAMVNMRYGSPDVLELTEVEKPIPKDDEALVKVHAASVNPADWHLREARRTLPACNSGCANRRIGFWGAIWQVEAVGRNVTMLQPGDDVFGSPFVHGFGAFAECVCVSEELLAPKLATLSFEQAAAVPLAASTALQGLRDHGRIESGQKVLIIGASGGVERWTRARTRVLVGTPLRRLWRRRRAWTLSSRRTDTDFRKGPISARTPT